jgi:hypothetical protein
MTPRTFFVQLGILSLSVGVMSILLHQMTELRPYWSFSIVNWVFFVILSITLFAGGRIAAQSANKNTFTNFSLASMLLKMILCVSLVLIYKQVAVPDSLFFILPFFIQYVVFMVFEVYFLSRLAKSNGGNRQPGNSNN